MLKLKFNKDNVDQLLSEKGDVWSESAGGSESVI